MKKITLVSLAVLSSILLSYNLNAQGKTLSEKRNLSSFSKIDVGNEIELFLTQGDEQYVRVETDTHAIEELTSEVADGVLYLRVNPLQKKSKMLCAYVTVRDLKGIRGHGSSKVILKTPLYTKDDIEINLAESAIIKDGELSGNNVTINAAGLSNIKGLKLKAGNISATLSGSSEANLDVSCNEVSVLAESKAEAQLKGKTNKLSASVRNSSTVKTSSLKFQASIIDTADGASYKN